MIILYETNKDYYVGTFGHCTFDKVAGTGSYYAFMIQFVVLRKYHLAGTVIPQNRIRLSDNSSFNFSLILDDMLHDFKREAAQLVMPAVIQQNVYMLDIGSCIEVITLKGKTDELSSSSFNPTKEQLENAIHTWTASTGL